jgi:hypothetical protein
VTLPAHALLAVHVRLKSVSNEGHLTLDAETVFRPYLPSHSSVVNEICHVVFSAHASHAGQVSSKSDGKEGDFIHEAEIFFVLISPRIGVG